MPFKHALNLIVVFQHHGFFYFVFSQVRGKALDKIKHVTTQERTFAEANFGGALLKHMAGIYFNQVGVQLFANGH